MEIYLFCFNIPCQGPAVFQHHGECLSEPYSASGVQNHVQQQYSNTLTLMSSIFGIDNVVSVLTAPLRGFKAVMKESVPCAVYCSAEPLSYQRRGRAVESVGRQNLNPPHCSFTNLPSLSK